MTNAIVLEESLPVYTGYSDKSPILKELKKGESINFDTETDFWDFRKIFFDDNSVGYFKKDAKLFFNQTYKTTSPVKVYAQPVINEDVIITIPAKIYVNFTNVLIKENQIWFIIEEQNKTGFISESDFSNLSAEKSDNMSETKEKPSFTSGIIWLVIGIIALAITYSGSERHLIITGTNLIVDGGISFGWLGIIVGGYKIGANVINQD